MGGRKDLDPLRLSKRSNGLAFSHHHFFSTATPTRPIKKDRGTVLSYIESKSTTRVREKLTIATTIAEEDGNCRQPSSRQPIRSLIPPELAFERPYTGSKRPYGIRHRNSESSISIKSFSSSVTSRKPRYGRRQTLATMPSEILDIIMTYLSQKDLHALMQTNTNITEVAAVHMYKVPAFASTYRYAQFTHTVSHKKHYADMVRDLDVSSFGKEPYDERQPQAGWREWKYRDSSLHQVNRNRLAKGGNSKGSGSSHPPPNPFLETWSLSRDIPIGGLCHTIIACQRLRKVDISRLQLGSDFVVRHVEHPATTWTGMIYVSDIQRSWTWEPQELVPVYSTYIIDQLRNLVQLEAVIANNFISLSTLMAQNLVYSCPQLKWVDFRKSGMTLEQPWKIKGEREKVAAILRELEDTT